MGAGERETCRLGMAAELLRPAIHAVTGLTLRVISCRYMIHRLCILIIGEVTENAVRAETPVQTDRRVFMAALTLDCRMRAHKREPVLVLVYIS
jgi:hypothetical protein